MIKQKVWKDECRFEWLFWGLDFGKGMEDVMQRFIDGKNCFSRAERLICMRKSV